MRVYISGPMTGLPDCNCRVWRREVPNKMRLLADRIEAAWNRREICDRMNREAAIGKEEDAKYEYEIQGKYEGKWLTEAKNFSSINEAKVNRPAEWEVVE